MGITPASASAIQQGEIRAQVATAVASKSFDVVKDQGAAMMSLLENAADLQRNMTHDIPIDGHAHKGQHIDIRA